ncbi:hypothetical protein [Pseudoxanthomonas sp. JBR18]|uniref:hypothetical protein n=1 Tax=Pseudoxanthomonas sp. JBR18 TaxID=2969308 RepID=UPI00230679E2|nr:hypothetical protein [Pseudoxanthomonas sp. JBR18]WCE04157.1 hypothetical protein PJ250_19120 [Pseudoxanthomonas sp. JBR18]
MSTHETHGLHDAQALLDQEGRLPLVRLSAHLRLLAGLAQRRAEDGAGDGLADGGGGELAGSLQLLADRLDRVLSEAYPPSSQADTADTIAYEVASDEDEDEDDDDAEADDEGDAEAGDFLFGVTLDQIDTLNRLVHAITAHGDVVAASDMAEYADGTLAQMGHTVFDAGLEVRAVLEAVASQRLRERAPLGRVREVRAVYGVGALLH